MINLKSDSAVKYIQKVNEQIDNIRMQIRKNELITAQGAILRAKARWMQQGEHNTAYFYRLEKHNSTNKIMNMVKSEKDQMITDTKGILKEQAGFYLKLYRANSNFECSLDDKKEASVKITEKMYKEAESDITLDEIESAIKTMAHNKSPGMDGLPVEFYVLFWGKIKGTFYDMVKQVIKEGILHKSAHTGLITLIPKADRDLKFIKNWRPIILLNTDYKILSKVLANRLKKLLEMIIHSDQTGFVKGRQITENIRKLLDVIEYTKKEKIKGLLISVDFEKAFDKVEYKAVYKALSWFGYGQNMIKMIMVLFEEFRMQTSNNGYFSDEFCTTKGLFQGNPIAPYLFIVIIELLAIKIRENKHIRGVKIKEEELLLSLFADDLAIVIDHDKTVMGGVADYFLMVSTKYWNEN